ncbi:MAG TPA: IS1182 family transposase [Hyphomicrobiaceae bacterium]|nr:IS1182 family transposase [Hyphomicrobiaceae bacterium]
MAKTFRPWDVDQQWMLPPSLHEFVPAGHVAHFIRETVRTDLDLGAILSVYEEERGFPPFHPAMMTALLLYGYSRGVYSSRKLAQACVERLDFMAVTAMNRPDFRTIAKFRARHLEALEGLFLQALKLCAAAGLVKLGHVALDGTKIAANASAHKAMSYGRMKAAEPKLAAEIEAWFAQADASDRDEDSVHGEDMQGDEMPDWVADKQARLQRIQAAKAALEEEARSEPGDDPDGPGPSSGMMRSGRPQRGPGGGPPDRAQRNFTDPDSRIQPVRSGFIAGYNAQIAVDEHAQVIVSQHVQTNPADRGALKPLLTALRANLKTNPKEVSADAGYCDEANLAHLERRGINAYLATGRAGKAQTSGQDPSRKSELPRTSAMALKIRRARWRSRYRLRKKIVEPVFGQIKGARAFRQFLLRGLDKVRGEWALICTAHNLLKLHKAA